MKEKGLRPALKLDERDQLTFRDPTVDRTPVKDSPVSDIIGWQGSQTHFGRFFMVSSRNLYEMVSPMEG